MVLKAGPNLWILFVGNTAKYTHVKKCVSVEIDHTSLISSPQPMHIMQFPVLYPSIFFYLDTGNV